LESTQSSFISAGVILDSLAAPSSSSRRNHAAMARRVIFFLLISVLAVSPAAYSADQIQPSAVDDQAPNSPMETVIPDHSYKIGTITIIPGNVFDLSNPTENGFIGRIGDKLHIVTRESTIRNELLFQEGDPYDKDIVEETERNLRLRQFLTDVELIIKPVKETKTVDITVKTRDQWTLLFGSAVGGTNENSMVGADIGEKNLLGLGQSVSYSYRHDNSGSYHAAGFSDQNLMGSRYALAMSYLQTPVEIDRSLSLQEPFYSLETESSHGFHYATQDHFEPTLNYNNFRLTTFYGVAYDLAGVIVRPFIVLSVGEQNLFSYPSPPTLTRDNKVELLVNLLAEPRNFAKDTYIQKFRQVEDIALGAQYSYLLGEGLVAIGSTTTEISMSFQVTKWTKLFERDYLYAGLTLAENDDSFNKQLADFQIQYYYRDFLQHTMFLNFQASYLDSDSNRFYLGGTTGLRGYNVNKFVGRDRFLLNLEDRIFTYKAILWGILEPGFVLFVDSGNAWNNLPDDTFHGLHTSFGAGLRLAVLKAPGISLVKIDYGVPIDINGVPVLTIGMSGTF